MILLNLPITLYTLYDEFVLSIITCTGRTDMVTGTWSTVSVVILPVTTKTRLCGTTNLTYCTPVRQNKNREHVQLGQVSHSPWVCPARTGESLISRASIDWSLPSWIDYEHWPPILHNFDINHSDIFWYYKFPIHMKFRIPESVFVADRRDSAAWQQTQNQWRLSDKSALPRDQ